MLTKCVKTVCRKEKKNIFAYLSSVSEIKHEELYTVYFRELIISPHSLPLSLLTLLKTRNFWHSRDMLSQRTHADSNDSPLTLDWSPFLLGKIEQMNGSSGGLWGEVRESGNESRACLQMSSVKWLFHSFEMALNQEGSAASAFFAAAPYNGRRGSSDGRSLIDAP